jgi:hypothetical protein
MAMEEFPSGNPPRARARRVLFSLGAALRDKTEMLGLLSLGASIEPLELADSLAERFVAPEQFPNLRRNLFVARRRTRVVTGRAHDSLSSFGL